MMSQLPNRIRFSSGASGRSAASLTEEVHGVLAASSPDSSWGWYQPGTLRHHRDSPWRPFNVLVHKSLPDDVSNISAQWIWKKPRLYMKDGCAALVSILDWRPLFPGGVHSGLLFGLRDPSYRLKSSVLALKHWCQSDSTTIHLLLSLSRLPPGVDGGGLLGLCSKGRERKCGFSLQSNNRK